MKKIIKKKGQTNKSNKTQKKILLSALAVCVLVVIIFFPYFKRTFELISAKIASFATVLSSALVLETNDFRATNNESGLVVSDLLTQAAQMKADDMAAKGYFSHVSPSGEEPWVWFNKIGYKYTYAGENLAVDYTESADVTKGWINSAKHKANLLNVNFTEVGIGVADGMLDGHKTTFVVQFFAKPFIAEAPKAVVAVKKVETPVKEATVASAVPIAQEIATTTPTQSLASTSPETAVATRSDLPKGQVLGTEVENTDSTNTNNPIKLFGIIGLGLLVVIVAILKIYTVRSERNTKAV